VWAQDKYDRSIKGKVEVEKGSAAGVAVMFVAAKLKWRRATTD